MGGSHYMPMLRLTVVLLTAHVCGSVTPTTNVTTTTTTTTVDAVEVWTTSGMEDATWVLTSAFVILTMQSGFGLLESGSVSQKFEVNVMMKNVIDVVFGGISFWMIGYGISWGHSASGIIGTDRFFVNTPPSVPEMARANDFELFSHYIFQFTFCSTATTIVSGAVAGRMKFTAYMMFSFINAAIYSVTCHWVWNKEGWLKEMEFFDFAGDGPVHLMGGFNALIAAHIVGPRTGRWDPEKQDQFGMQTPMSCVLGLFMLWWGWLGFNCGSTFGISGHKWLIASHVSVTTINASMAAGVFGVAFSYFYWTPGCVEVEHVVNSILAGLVSITGGCSAVSPVESLLIGAIGAMIATATNIAFVRYKFLDDPVGAVGVHGCASIWGLLAVGIFGQSERTFKGGPQRDGLIHGGGLELLGIQAVGVLAIAAWTATASHLSFRVLNMITGLRADLEHELQGFDASEHRVAPPLWEAKTDELLRQMAQMQLALATVQGELKLLREGAEEVPRKEIPLEAKLDAPLMPPRFWCQDTTIRV